VTFVPEKNKLETMSYLFWIIDPRTKIHTLRIFWKRRTHPGLSQIPAGVPFILSRYFISANLSVLGLHKENKKRTGVFKIIVGVLTTCHTQYTWDRRICILLFSRTTLHVFVTYLTGALYVHPLWFYKPQHDNRVRSACQRRWFQWRLWFVPSVPGYLREKEEHKPDPWRNPIERNHMDLHLEFIVYDPDSHFE